MDIIAIINQKGGVGKSTTAHALGAGLFTRGRRVLFVDMDAQGNLSHSLKAEDDFPTLLEVLTGQVAAKGALQQGESGDFIAAGQGLAAADTLLSQTGKEFKLKEALASLAENYDVVLLDTPPSLGVLTVNALTAASRALVPAQADIYSIQGVMQLMDTVDAVKRYCNPQLKIAGILLTRYTPRTILTRDLTDMLAETAEKLGTKVFDAKIRETVILREAQAMQTNIFSYAPKSGAAADYAELLDELGM
jgi:chromosome partitioning protein